MSGPNRVLRLAQKNIRPQIDRKPCGLTISICRAIVLQLRSDSGPGLIRADTP